MAVSRKFFRIALTVLLLCTLALAADFTWDWHNQQVIGRDDPSVANTSKLKESDRTALIDAIAARLQKPMSERGYSDDRIREVASIARIRIVDLGGKGDSAVLAYIDQYGGRLRWFELPVLDLSELARWLCFPARHRRRQLYLSLIHI